MRTVVIAGAICLAVIGLATADDVRAAIRKQTSIPAQELGSALKELAAERGFQILFITSVIGQTHTKGVFGYLTPGEALERLLTGSGLTFKYLDEQTVSIVPVTQKALPQALVQTPDDTAGDIQPDKSNAMRMAQATGSGAGAAVVAQKAAQPTQNQYVELQEVVVTAEKRVERALDVPVPVTTVNTGDLIETHQTRIEDYYTKVPGLSVSLQAPDGTPSIAIRGLTTGGVTNPTVGLVIDDMPYGTTITVGNSLTAVDIDPNDVAQIEVLRGPQGTLYGASSIGGLIKITTIDPSTDAVSARVSAGTIGVKNGSGAGYDFRGSINIPLNSVLAMRASAFAEEDPGYIDNLRTGQDGVNERRSSGGRLAALWRLTDAVSLKLSAIVQQARRDHSTNVDLLPGLGDLQQNEAPGTGLYERKSQAYGATLKARIGSGELTSATGYSIDRLRNNQDDSTTTFGAAAARYNVTGAANFGTQDVNKFSQELRYSLPVTQRLEWIVGGFYTHEKDVSSADFRAIDQNTGAQVGDIAFSETPDVTFHEYAAFTDLTAHFTDNFDTQLGARYSNNKLSYYSMRGGPLLGNKTTISTQYNSSGSPVTYLVTPRLKLSSDLMLYARVASGYRPGVPNINCGLTNVPCQSNADTTWNYEIGMKGALLERLLTFDASVYYIDWKNIQLNAATSAGLGFTANEGQAKSQGVELSLESRPARGLTLSTWLTWNDAELTEGFPTSATVLGKSGDRLPYGARFSGNLSVNDDFPLWGTASGFVGATVSYVGDRKGLFRGAVGGVPLSRQDYPGYAQLDARCGTKWDTWTVSVFANNLTDKRGLIGGDVANFVPFAYNYTQPRTVGLSVAKIFDAGH